MEKIFQEQQNRISNISLSLRKEYYQKTTHDECFFVTPHGIAGNMTESIGAWPEFIFKGTFCSRTFKGFCSPCFYSQFSLHKPAGEKYHNMVRSQFSYVIDNFEELVAERQFGRNWAESDPPILTPTGSFFDENEFPQLLRIEMLNKLLLLKQHRKQELHMLLECHCKDWNELDCSSEESQREINLLKSLNARILFGFESADDYVRNVIYNKHLDIDEFYTANHKAHAFGLETGVFIFAGLFSMNDALTIQDVTNSIRFAINNSAAPVIMFQNVQQYTINEVLFQAKEINLIEPFTVMEIILNMIDILIELNAENIEWLIADPKGGPPVPEFNIFDCSCITSPDNANAIYDMVCRLRLTRNLDEFKQSAMNIKSTDNYKQYRRMIGNCFKRDELYENTNRLIDVAERIINNR